jgi:regulator of RNase E activity RraA
MKHHFFAHKGDVLIADRVNFVVVKQEDEASVLHELEKKLLHRDRQNKEQAF